MKRSASKDSDISSTYTSFCPEKSRRSTNVEKLMASETVRKVKRACRRYAENGRKQQFNDGNYYKNNEKQIIRQIDSTHGTRTIYSKSMDCSTTYFNSSEESLQAKKSKSPNKGTTSPATPEVNPVMKIVSEGSVPSKSTVTEKRPATSSGSPPNKRRKTERSSRTGNKTSNRPRPKTTTKRSVIRLPKQSRRAVGNRSVGGNSRRNSNRPRTTRSIKRPVSNSKTPRNKNRRAAGSRGTRTCCRCKSSRFPTTRTPKRPPRSSKNLPARNRRAVRNSSLICRCNTKRSRTATSSVLTRNRRTARSRIMRKSICRCNNKRKPHTSSRRVNKRRVRRINLKNCPVQNKSTLMFIVQEVVKRIPKSWRNAASTKVLRERKRRTRKKNSEMKTSLAKCRERQRKKLHQGCTSRGILCRQCESIKKFQLTKSICDSIGKALQAESL